MDVSKNRGVYPPKWMVYFMENLVKMDDLGVPLFLETPIFTLPEANIAAENGWLEDYLHFGKAHFQVLR